MRFSCTLIVFALAVVPALAAPIDLGDVATEGSDLISEESDNLTNACNTSGGSRRGLSTRSCTGVVADLLQDQVAPGDDVDDESSDVGEVDDSSDPSEVDEADVAKPTAAELSQIEDEWIAVLDNMALALKPLKGEPMPALKYRVGIRQDVKILLNGVSEYVEGLPTIASLKSVDDYISAMDKMLDTLPLLTTDELKSIDNGILNLKDSITAARPTSVWPATPAV